MLGKNFPFILVILCYLLAEKVEGQQTRIRCPLTWEDHEIGNAPGPKAIPTADGDRIHYIIRAKDPAGIWAIGRLERNTWGVSVLIVDSTTGKVTDKFGELQILTNGHGCDLSWMEVKPGSSIPSGDFLTPVESSNRNKVVGRSLVSNAYLSGEVDVAGKVIRIAHFVGTTPGPLTTFWCLHSSSNGLTTEFNTFQFSGEPLDGSLDFLGIDEINNNGEVTISQEVVHRKTVTTFTSMSSSSTYSRYGSLTVNLEYGFIFRFFFLWFYHVSYSFTEYLTETSTYTRIGREHTEEISTSRNLIVPPGQHVQACTLVGKIDKFSRPYSATAKYTAKGWTGMELLQHLKSLPNPPPNLVQYADYVTSTTSGEMDGAFFLNNVMLVVNKSPGNDCSEIMNLVDELNTLQEERRRGNFATKERELEIQEKINAIASPTRNSTS